MSPPPLNAAHTLHSQMHAPPPVCGTHLLHECLLEEILRLPSLNDPVDVLFADLLACNRRGDTVGFIAYYSRTTMPDNKT